MKSVFAKEYYEKIDCNVIYNTFEGKLISIFSDNQLLAKIQKNLWFKLFKCDNLVFFFVIYDIKWNILRQLVRRKFAY